MSVGGRRVAKPSPDVQLRWPSFYSENHIFRRIVDGRRTHRDHPPSKRKKPPKPAAFHDRSALDSRRLSMPSMRGNHSEISGRNVTATRNASIVSSHGHTAMVSSVMPFLALPDATYR